MKRKKLSRVCAPSNQHRGSNQTQEPKSRIVRQKVIQNQEHCPNCPPCRVNPFKKKMLEKKGKLSTTKIGGTGNKKNTKFTTNVMIFGKKVNKSNNKKQCTLDYFFGSKKGL